MALRNSSDTADADVSPATLAAIRNLCMPPNAPPSSLFDGDQPPPEILLTSLTAPRVEKEPASILTLRGNHRGRVIMTESRSREQ